MNRKFFLLLIILFLSNTGWVFSQKKITPGNVQEPYFWIKSRTNSEAYYWESMTVKQAKIPANVQKGTPFNFNPSIIVDNSKDSLIFPLGIDSKKKQTIFMVYKVNDSLKEQFLWTIDDPKKTVSVATNKRLADFNKYNYQSYDSKVKPQKANIHFFQQNKTDTLAKPSSLTIGLNSKFAKLPPETFSGNISEILVYNRFLSGVETQKVASYLAIKYGISLSQFEIKNYINSAGQKIWDNDKHKGFDSSITGIGRDDGSGLLQVKSSNMANEGLLTIELKSKNNKIPDNYFAFWSDNGKNLLVKKQEQGEPTGIDRQWQLDFAGTSDLTLDWSLDPKFIKGTLPQDTYYWLLVDHSGKGTYDENNSEYIKLGSTSRKEKLVLNDFNWGRQKSGSTKFTIKVAPQMFSRVWISEANCDVLDSGEMHYSIVGGEAPYTITVKKEGTSTVLKQWSQTANSSSGLQLSSGNYDYIVRDAKGNLYSETVFVADKEGTFPKLKSDYLLTDGNALLLDASLGLPNENYEFEWLYEGNFMDNTAKILVDQAGVYELRVLNSQGCKTRTKIQVATDGKKAMNSNVTLLYPNPTVDGRFSVVMQFAQKTNANIRIYTLNGTLIKEQQFSQIDNYIHDEILQVASGMYLVTVNSDYESKTFKVIVK